MNYYNEYIKKAIKEGQEQTNPGISIPLKEFSKFSNFIQPGQYVGIGGKYNAGKTSYMDHIYLMNVYLWWKNLEESKKVPIKFIYFNMKHSLKNKIQKLTCLHCYLNNQLLIDIPTLNNQIGKMYDLKKKELEIISESIDFFEDMFNNDMLTIINGPQTPTSIFNKVNQEMKKRGKFDEENKFIFDKEYKNQLTFLLIDNADFLSIERDESGQLDGFALRKKINDYLIELGTTYNNLTRIIIIPSVSGNSRVVKDTEPNYKELGIFNKGIDLGLVLYNPFNEGNINYGLYKIKEWVIGSKNRFRSITVVKNINGVENATKALNFFGECGCFTEMPRAEEDELLEERLNILRQLH